jgi:hypothetical protein
MNCFEIWARRAAVSLIATGAVAAAGTGVASAATPHAHRPGVAAAASPRVHAADAVSADPPENGGDYEFHISNDSSTFMVYKSQSGSVSVPGVGPGSVWSPGQEVDFHAQWCYTTDCYGDINWEVYASNGDDLGTLDIHLDGSNDYGNMKFNGADQHQSDSQFTTNQDSYSQSGQNWYLSAGYNNNINNEIEDTTPSTQNFDQNMPAVQGVDASQLVKSLCDGAGSSGCQYNVSTSTPGYSDYHVIASMYDAHSVDGEPDRADGTLTTQTGWSTSLTNSWDIQATAGTNILDTVDTSFTAEYGQSYTNEQNFSTSSSANIYPQQTAQIMASYPTYTDTGSFSITVGNTTWNASNVNFVVPRTAAVDGYGTSVQTCAQWVDGNVDPHNQVDPGVNGPEATVPGPPASKPSSSSQNISSNPLKDDTTCNN